MAQLLGVTNGLVRYASTVWSSHFTMVEAERLRHRIVPTSQLRKIGNPCLTTGSKE